jgi:hypothetical protein
LAGGFVLHFLCERTKADISGHGHNWISGSSPHFRGEATPTTHRMKSQFSLKQIDAGASDLKRK